MGIFFRDAENQRDFTPEDLPSTRREQLWDLIRNQWRLLMGLSVVLTVCALPLVLALFTADYLKLLELESLAGAEDAERLLCCCRWDIASFLLSLPAGAALAVGAGGACKVLQQLIWGEGVLFSHDFAQGVGENWRRFLLSAGLGCAALFSVDLVLDSVACSGEDPVFLAFSAAVTLTAALFLGVAAVYVAAQALWYETGAGESLKNALILTAAYFPQNLLLAACMAAPAALACAFGVAGRLVLLAVLAIFGFSSGTLAVLLYCAYIFDQSINRQLGPGHVGRGLYRPPEGTGGGL